jgi:hypothetical protein
MSGDEKAKDKEDPPKLGLQRDLSVVAAEDDFCLKFFDR